MSRRAVLAVLVLVLALSVAACGESKEDKAQKAVCAARADIKKQVDELKGMTVTTASLDGVQTNLRAIRDGLTKIADARGDLKGERREQVDKATRTFKGAVAEVGRELVKSVSVSDAKQQIQTALQGLASSYQAAFAPVDCS
jgi:hypothetical protein